jgi:CRP/FNR family cyclic AMP-dependent transcriptional regulator
MANKRVEMLASVPLFHGLSRNELREVLNSATEVEFAPGTVIVKQGQEARDFYLISSGRARLVVRAIREAPLEAGDYFGEISVIDGGPRSATVTAETHVSALRLNRESFLRILDRHGSIGRKILAEMCRRLREAEGELVQH